MDKDYFDFPDRRHIYLCTFQHTVLPHSEDHDGKDKSAEQNADMCLFLEEWENNRESFQQYCMAKDAYEDWKDKTLAYYASQGVEIEEPENLDTEERLKRRNALFSGK